MGRIRRTLPQPPQRLRFDKGFLRFEEPEPRFFQGGMSWIAITLSNKSTMNKNDDSSSSRDNNHNKHNNSEKDDSNACL